MLSPPPTPTYPCALCFSKMLSMGSSKPWPDAMEVITGQREMDATALRDYFQPLEDWLKRENQENQETIGWTTGQWPTADG